MHKTLRNSLLTLEEELINYVLFHHDFLFVYFKVSSIIFVCNSFLIICDHVYNPNTLLKNPIPIFGIRSMFYGHPQSYDSCNCNGWWDGPFFFLLTRYFRVCFSELKIVIRYCRPNNLNDIP